MNWGTIAWVVIAIVAIFVMVRGCGGMMGGMRGGGCGMPRRGEGAEKKNREKSGGGKAA